MQTENPVLALETRGLNRYFGAVRVSSDVNFRLPQGARHALIGPNGAGKTTFINLLTGNLSPSSGTVHFANKDVTALSVNERVRQGIARTFQINSLLREMTVLENVQLSVLERRTQGSLLLSGRKAQRAAAESAYDLLERLGLASDASSFVQRLPYGRQRLVEIAIALAREPTILLLDEPAAGVPPADSYLVFDLIEALPSSISVLFIEHDMKLVARFAQRISVLVAGEIMREGSPEEIAKDPYVREVYLGHGRNG
ncbi:branched-chain amino acid transport system ATP-binding protein [Tardiphaga sp. OK246]|uniref:ABC transporter ATP-binding protein n=1 Tax=Tardiphaga sp. OK246 TaxID=1855307 RepID=UPI000B6858A8|nr:ABC transporter ATP-binding protein [Tardiphaga sp. OK246]SNT31810.1 branched-chain amino acid transport system ATP-binding protein [Tardiphaga sp. OK246]